MITVIGSANMDAIARVVTLPGAGSTALATGFQRLPGGKGANQAVAAARAGGEVAFVGCVGDDVYGKELVDTMAEAGVATDHVRVLQGQPSGVAMITVDDQGENCIVVIPGANASVEPTDVDAAADMIARSSAILLQLEIPLQTVAHALRVARKLGVTAILNPAPAQSLDPAMLKLVDVLVPNEQELAHLSGIGPPLDISMAANLLVDSGVGTVVVTLGHKGVFAARRGDSMNVPMFPVQAVDTTGAGDTFVGNLAAALDRGARLDAALRFASAAAALSITRPGAQAGRPWRSETEQFLSEEQPGA